MPRSAGITEVVLALAGYLVLQVVLNIVILRILARHGRDPRHALTATFWSGAVNACYFGICGLMLLGNTEPGGQRPWPLYYSIPLGLVTGVVLWYLLVLARKLGIEIFGRGRLIAAEDAILAVPPRPAYVWFGLGNLALLQPLSREIFFRAVMLPAVALEFGWTIAVTAVLAVELLLKLNVVWVFAVIVNTLILCGLYFLTGGVVCCVTAAAVAGLIHGLALNKTANLRIAGDSQPQVADSGRELD